MTIITEATREQLEGELAARRAAGVLAATADASVAAQAYIGECCTTVDAAGISAGDETTDEQYITLALPNPLPANWQLVRQAMSADPALKAIDGNGVLRVRKDRVYAVLDFLEVSIF